MVLRMPRCQMEKNGYDSSSYALNNPNCKLTPYLDNISFLGILWHIGAGDCGNIKTENSTHITYNNSLYISPKPSAFITKNKFIYNFSCIYPRNMDTALFPLNVATGINTTILPGVIGKITVSMAVFTDSSFTNAVTVNTLLVVEQMVYVSVLMQTVDNYALKVVNLYTSASNRSTDVKYYLLQNGCPNTALGNFLFKTIWNGQFTEARFQMKMAKISGSDVIYLFADLVLCNNSCTPNCNSRSTIDQSYDTTVSMRLQFDSASSNLGSFSMKWALSSLLLPLILMAIM
ncbi:hypothetical protein XELAEV_18000367mg [Xenopus laevis]|uniref:ZP domain-containing protein n=2 Tax=Xenopus laevis TaxID=8355 RepID=A0A974BQK1_XENLA|nr:hypothetical protein XELAEV_18000367mg [Xenopus laevis]